jgi:hypothetical protein
MVRIDLDISGPGQDARLLCFPKAMTCRHERKLSAEVMQRGSRHAFEQALSLASHRVLVINQQMVRAAEFALKGLTPDQSHDLAPQATPRPGFPLCDARRIKTNIAEGAIRMGPGIVGAAGMIDCPTPHAGRGWRRTAIGGSWAQGTSCRGRHH